MRKFCFAAFAAVLIGTTACTPKAPEQFTGKIVDGTMNTVTVESPADGRRVTFTTEDADMQEAYGLLLGNTATVTYRGKLGETTPALKVVTDPAYVTAIGRWVEPNPIDPEEEQGISGEPVRRIDRLVALDFDEVLGGGQLPVEIVGRDFDRFVLGEAAGRILSSKRLKLSRWTASRPSRSMRSF